MIRAPHLLGLYALVWGALAIDPVHRDDWLLENLLVAAALLGLWRGYRTLRFSMVSYGCLFVFSVLHAIGAHYTYSEVPYDHWGQVLFGYSVDEMFGLSRNHYDRLVHFGYGLLVAPAAIELLDARAPQQGVWRWCLPWLFLCAHSAVYEMLEWMAAVIVAPELGQAFLGTQGDAWDAQKDTSLAALGAAISVTLVRVRALRAAASGPG